MVIFISLTIVSLIFLLFGEWKSDQRIIWLAKPAASVGFLGTALMAGALEKGIYGQLICLALALSLLGDVLLIPKSKRMFLLGILSFLLAHIGYIFAFILGFDQLNMFALIISLVLLLFLAAYILNRLWSGIPQEIKMPAIVYTLVINVMLATAFSIVVVSAPWIVLIAALMFYISDLSVARDRFVSSRFVNKLWGLPLYYGAQLIFACSVLVV